MRRSAWCGALAAFVALGAACARDEARVISRQDAPAEVAKVVCSAFFDCDCAAQQSVYGDEASCRDLVTIYVEEFLKAGDDAGLTYNAECASNYGDAYREIGCASISEAGYLALTDAGFVIALENYTTCKWYSGEGGAGDDCEVTTYADEVVGDSCVVELACVAGRCEYANIDGDKSEGHDCDLQQQNCEPGLACVPIDSLDDTRCQVLPGPGQTCMGVGDACRPDSYCDQLNKRCTALPGPGEMCAPEGNPFALGARCAYGSDCTGGAQAEGTCVALPDEGEPCASGMCGPGLTCAGNVCTPETAAVCLYG